MVPKINSTKYGVRVCHKEYIADIQPTSAMTTSEYAINPGLDDTFPWLSQLAGSFQQYKWNALVFSYKSTSTDQIGSGATQLGSVILSTDYDCLDQTPSTKRELLNMEFASTAKPSLSFLHVIDCAKKRTSQNDLFFTRNEEIEGDRRLSDIGKLIVATEGIPTNDVNAVIGELWVSYEITFYKPKFHISSGVEQDVFYFDLNTVKPTTGSVLQVFGDPNFATRYGNLGCSLSKSSASGGTRSQKIYFPRDSVGKGFLVNYYILSTVPATGTGINGISVTPGNGAIVLQGGTIPTVGSVPQLDGDFIIQDAGNNIQFAQLDSAVGNHVQYYSTTVAVFIPVWSQANIPKLTFAWSDLTSGFPSPLPGTAGNAVSLIITECSQAAYEPRGGPVPVNVI